MIGQMITATSELDLVLLAVIGRTVFALLVIRMY